MNLHHIVRGAIGSVNPDRTVTYQASTGFTTDSTGKRIPTYDILEDVSAQIQGVSGREVQLLMAMGIQGVLRSVHLYGNAQGVVRPDEKGGDLMVFAQVPGEIDQTWKVVKVMETWPDWSRVIVCLQ